MKLPASAIDMLKSYRAWQAECRLQLGDRWQLSDRLFTNWCGEPIRPDTVSAWFHSFIKKTDLPQVSIHSLRHTNATLQIMAGVPLRTVSDRLGHAKTSTTSDIYSHAIQSSDEAAAEALEDVLNPVKRLKATK
jgi:integrase